MIPKGKMMANMLKRDSEGGFSLVKFHCNQKESPEENKALEEEFSSFMELGITSMRKEGELGEYSGGQCVAFLLIQNLVDDGEEITCFIQC